MPKIVSGKTSIRVVASGQLPAWRMAMTQNDRLYNVSAAEPDQANSSIVFPGGVVPYGFTTNELYARDVISGYASGVLVEDVGGLYGTMIYGTGGHTRIQTQLLSLSISDDSPTFGWFQQPQFETSAINGAEIYYNRAEFDALPTNRKTGNGVETEGDMTAAWLAAGGQFPMGYEGWIFPKKLIYGQLGRNNPHGFRYMAPCYLPIAMTGTGAGGYLVVEAPQGPFAQSWIPAGSKASDLTDPSALWPSGNRKWPIWCKNVRTGAWTRLQGFQPDYPPYGFIRQHTAVSRSQKRVYVSVDVGSGTTAYWYIDFANGIANATVSGLVAPATQVAPNRATPGAFTEGHPGGRHLWYWPDLENPAGFVLQDLDSRTQARLNIGQGLSVPASSEPGMQYDATNNRIFIIQNYGGSVIKYRSVSIPSDPLNAAGYVVSTEKTLSVDSSVSIQGFTHFYGKVRFIPELGVILIPQEAGRMLAFRPS